ncbi:bifunctional hydroxymethylpyrimidine kinase/phosphomethylpyrimidine kinase, partial [Candidatus Micrarchaeota archaeon CG08_land_8_20_14_0_20_59_11]
SPALVDACVRAGLSTVEVSRLEEPERVSSVEGASMPWLASQVIRKHGGAPDVFWSRGSFGKEATVCVLGANPREVLAKTRRAFRTAAY